MTNDLIPTNKDEFETRLDALKYVVKPMVLNALNSDLSRAMYDHALDEFLGWWGDQGDAMGWMPFNKATVNAYKEHLQSSTDLAPATINQRISAIRKLASEASDSGYMDPYIANGISRVKGITKKGVRTGNWLTFKEAERLINTPNIETTKGLRDRAILAVLIGSGLRRAEVADLTFAHIQQREGRWAIVDLIGKFNRIRTVPIPPWVKQAIDEWAAAAGINQGNVFRWVNRGGNLGGDRLSDESIARVVAQYAKACGYTLAAHDLRRTFAKLSRKGGADLMQIQLVLGHSSLETTQKYLGEELDYANAPGDFIKVRLNKSKENPTEGGKTNEINIR